MSRFNNNSLGKAKQVPLDNRGQSPGQRNTSAKPTRAAPAPPGYAGINSTEQAEMHDMYPDSTPPPVPTAPPRVRSARLDSNITSLRDRVSTMDGSNKANQPGAAFRAAVNSSMSGGEGERDRSNTSQSSRSHRGEVGTPAAVGQDMSGMGASPTPTRPNRPPKSPKHSSYNESGGGTMSPNAPAPQREGSAKFSENNKGSGGGYGGGGGGGGADRGVSRAAASASVDHVPQPPQATTIAIKKYDASKFLGKRPLQYGLWAHRMAYMNAVLCLVAGSFALAFSRSKTYGCVVWDKNNEEKLINSIFLYNAQGNCPTKYIPPGEILGIDVCCNQVVKDSNLSAYANGNDTLSKFVGAIYIIYSVFIVIIEDIDFGIGYGMWFPSDTWFYDKCMSPMGVTHILMGIIGLTNLGTCVVGVCLIINGAVYLEAVRRQEAGDGGREIARKQKERDAKSKAAEAAKQGKGGTDDDEVEFECSTCPKTFTKSPIFKSLEGLCQGIWDAIQYNPFSFLYRIWQEDKLAAYFWVTIFITVNIIMFGVTFKKWFDMIQAERDSMLDGTIDVLCDTTECDINRIAIKHGPFTMAAPLAKACGACLNMNCALLLLPVIKTILRKMNDFAEKFSDLQDKTDYFSKFFSHSFARYVPIQKNIEFHKLVAFTLGLMTMGHMIGHYANIVYAFDITTAYFEKWGWQGTSFFTGAIIFIAMFIIFSAAADIIRHTKFEIFFNAHHCFIVFYFIMFFHGPKFYYWGTVPVLLYIYERYSQTKKGSKPFMITKVEFIDPVMALYFKPVFAKDFQFKEGQYLYLSCPFISESEWHPFTISSAQDDMTTGPRIHIDSGEEVLEVPRPSNLHPNAKWNKYHLISQNWKDLNPNDYIDKSETCYNDYISCHIKIHGMEDPIAKTWTRKFKEYLEVVSGNVKGTNNFPFFFNSIDHRGDVQIGQLQDENGLQLLRVDGPHSAPSEHFTNYGTCMLVGAGIGLTPCASVISGLIKHRWKKGMNPEILHLYWVVRQSDVDSFQWLVHLLTELSYEYKKSLEGGLIASNFYCEFNIFVTAVDKKSGEKTPLPFQKPKRRYTGNTVEPLFSADKLYNLMLNPTVSSKKMVDTMRRASNHPNRLQDVWVWDGRPDWDQIFADIKDQRQHSDIGVCFCGAPVIGNDLKKMCERYSSSKDDCLFTLHKENF